MNKGLIIGIIILLIILGALIIILNTKDDSEQIVGGCAGVSLEYRQECCWNWTEEYDRVMPNCVGEWTIKDNECVWECETENFQLRDCSRNQENLIKCPKGYFCYYDDKCHKLCGIDSNGSDCPEETPFCLQKSFCIGDACTAFNGCFSEQ